MIFKVGDTVRILPCANGVAEEHIGETCELIKLHHPSTDIGKVKLRDCSECMVYLTTGIHGNCEIELVKEGITRTITLDNGSKIIGGIKMDLKNTRIKPRSPKEHRLIQKILFEHGCSWHSDVGKKNEVKSYSDCWIAINENLYMDNSGKEYNLDKTEISPDTILNINKQGENKMELKNIRKTNLRQAKAKYDEERTNEEVTTALNQLRAAQDTIDTIDRQIKALGEDKKPHQEIIDMFKSK